MLEALFSAPDNDAQSLKTTECFGGCGATVTYRTNARVYCQSCKIKNKRESARLAAERQRRKRGIPKVKGETFACEECGSYFVATSKSRAKYCQECRDVVALRRARETAYANDFGGTRKRVKGTTLVCVDCAMSFVATRNQVRCEECIPLVRPAHCGETICGDCGVSFPTDTRKRKFCDDCLLVRRRESSNKCALRRFREKRGEPEFDLNIIMRTRIAQSLRAKKNRVPWINFVDYTVAELKTHLERQFLPGMTWGNRKLWHVDHVRPLAQFSFSDPGDPEFKDAWALTNLRPLWAKDNIRKKDKRLFLI